MERDAAEAVARYELEKTLAAMNPLERALETIPEECLGERPVPEQQPVGPMIAHAFAAVAMCARAVRLGRGEEADFADLGNEGEAGRTNDGIRAMAETARNEVEATLRELDGEVASRIIEFYFGWKVSGVDAVDMGYAELLHHRGQVQSFLRLMGLEPPDVYDTSPAEEA